MPVSVSAKDAAAAPLAPACSLRATCPAPQLLRILLLVIVVVVPPEFLLRNKISERVPRTPSGPSGGLQVAACRASKESNAKRMCTKWHKINAKNAATEASRQNDS